MSYIQRCRRLLPLALATGMTAAGLAPITAHGEPMPSTAAEIKIDFSSSDRPVPGLLHQEFTVTASAGSSEGDLLQIDLADPRISTELVHARHVGARAPLTEIAAADDAFAAVNADFFNIATYDPPGLATDSADGPEITGGVLRKAAVPKAQRIGPQIPSWATGREVIGVGADGRGRTDTIGVRGHLRSSVLNTTIEGYNQYALPQDGIGVYDAAWGPVLRKRATCGSDTNRTDPCLEDGVKEVLVRANRVVSINDQAGAGQLGRDEIALLGREGGAERLEALSVGDAVTVHLAPTTDSAVPLRWAVGGMPNVVDSVPVDELSTTGANPVTAAGVSADGLTFYLVTIDGRSETSAGVTYAESAEIIRRMGVDDGIQLDAGGSSEMIMKPDRGAEEYDILNVPSDGAERPIPNGIGVFVR